jgi:hypothetical protein
LFEKELAALGSQTQLLAYQMQEFRKALDRFTEELRRANDLKETTLKRGI